MATQEFNFVSIVTGGIGAFLGAYFAFFFMRVTEHLRRVYDRQKKHYDTLVRFEHELNNYLNIINDNIQVIKNFRRTVENGDVYWSLPRTLPIYRELVVDLANLKIINELSGLNTTLRKINDDIENLTGAYSEIKRAYLSGRLNQVEYKKNASRMADGFETGQKAFQQLTNEVIDMLAHIRAQAPKDNPSGRRLLLSWSVKTGDTSKEEIEQQKKFLLDEIKNSREQSRQEIERTLGMNRD